MQTSATPSISICICTFQRPQALSALLRSLQNLVPSTPSSEVIVVDNDSERSAEPVVRQAILEGQEIVYLVEPIQSIALARNKSVHHARGEWLAFIDDDEEADSRWLSELWRWVQAGNVDAAFGVVEHYFDPGTPDWLRVSYPAQKRISGGAVIWWDAATNNALVRRSMLLELSELFDPVFGLTGGEDTDLFQRMFARGALFVGVSSAIVRERIPASRANARYLIKWWLCAGAATGRIQQRVQQKRASARSIAAWPRIKRMVGSGLLGALCFYVSRVRALRYLCAAAFESGFVYYQLSGRLPLRYPKKV